MHSQTHHETHHDIAALLNDALNDLLHGRTDLYGLQMDFIRILYRRRVE